VIENSIVIGLDSKKRNEDTQFTTIPTEGTSAELIGVSLTPEEAIMAFLAFQYNRTTKQTKMRELYIIFKIINQDAL